MNEREEKELRVRAEAGDTQAQIAFAQILDANERQDEAIKWLQKAVNSGDAHAKWLLAKQFLAQEIPESDHLAPALIISAAEGDAEAAHFMAVVHACGIGVPRDWSTAFDYLTHSAELGFPLAREELVFLATGAFDEERKNAPKQESWKKLRDAIELSSWLEVSPLKVISRDPRIMTVENVASPAICDWLIEKARPDRKAASVRITATGKVQQSDSRTNSTTSFNPFKMNIILAALRLRISTLTGLSSGMEIMNILHYTVGQRYEPHFDYIAASDAEAVRLTQGMQRVLTFLLYLNDDYEGGETRFPRIPWQHKGRKGNAMFFWNVDRQGKPDQMTLHEGSAPTKGEKWILSQWIRKDVRISSAHHPV
jgi:prolyl 4-hydroxylase